MMKPKAALVKAGFTEGDHTWSPGDENKRGRLSLAAKTECERLAASGWDIEGFKVTAATATAPATVERVPVTNGAQTIADIPDNPLRDDRVLKAIAYDKDGNPANVGMRKVCNICGSSLTYCGCPQPLVWVDFDHESVVNFKSI